MNTTSTPHYDRLIFNDPAHLQAAREFAARTNQSEKLEIHFSNLQAWSEQSNLKTWISVDFVPHSFYFQMYPDTFDTIPNDWQKHRHMNGGIIYHGPLEDGARPQTFSVNLTPQNSWSMHT